MRLSPAGSFIPGGLEVFYWNATTGVRIWVQYREQFTVALCPLPEDRFPPGRDQRGIDWCDAFEAVELVTGRRPRFSVRELYENDPAVIEANADALRGPCAPIMHGDATMWDRLRRQRLARH